MKKKLSIPEAASLIESMRSLGYSLRNAIADILDNSLSAQAKKIRIFAKWHEVLTSLAIIDDGHGMDETDLSRAMKLGSFSPREERTKTDLGRFGLGLKTASFSQCRRLTVVTSDGGPLRAQRWDLDDVVDSGKWELGVLDEDEIKNLHWIDQIPCPGTMILWEKLDNVIDQTEKKHSENHFYENLKIVEKHLGLVFHRYLAGEPGCKRVKIEMNDHPVSAFDPFNSNHPATILLPSEILNFDGHRIAIQPFILPHHKKCSANEYDALAMDSGYFNNQGFYIYRNKRLIEWGTWFRLKKKTNLSKLARVRIDLPNTVDSLWSLDVKKSRAVPPLIIRQRLKAVIDTIMGSSEKVYSNRGQRTTRRGITPVWQRFANKNEIHYEINKNHPMIEEMLAGLDENLHSHFCEVIKVLQKCFPLDAMFADLSNHPTQVTQNEFSEGEFYELATSYLNLLKSSKISDTDIKKTLKSTEPFLSHQSFLDNFLNEKGIL